MARIVVGVDGTERSRQALRRAAHEARLRDARLEAVLVYPPPHRELTDQLGGLPQGMDRGGRTAMGTETEEQAEQRRRRARREAHEELEGIVEETLGEDHEPAPRLVVIPHDEVADALVEHATGADMLVIGLRRRSPVGKLVLGSDARDIILRSKSPVFAVHVDLPPEE